MVWPFRVAKKKKLFICVEEGDIGLETKVDGSVEALLPPYKAQLKAFLLAVVELLDKKADNVGEAPKYKPKAKEKVRP
jgi:hypothetical protein